MDRPLDRRTILGEAPLDGAGALARGADRARLVRLGPNPFLAARGVESELAEKRRLIAERCLSFHAQIGYRDPAESRRAYAEIHDRLARHGAAPDRYGICLDWSMGYPAAQRPGRPCGTGMILTGPEDFVALTAAAPVAPHFGDFVLGMPAAVENASAALLAGSTTIGNLSQYFTFRLPGWDDDLGTTLATVEALGLLAAQDVRILVHSNLDDGYAAWFEDMGSALGFAMVERWIVEELIGLPLGQCFGHTFTEPVKRLAFQLALSRVNPTPGTMLYGNTTLYGPEPVANYGALASYLLVDAFSQWTNPSGHALTPIPVTEAQRIPTVAEIVEAHLAGRRLAERIGDLAPLLSTAEAGPLADRLVTTGTRFRDRLMAGLEEGGFDLADPAEMLLALRRIGPAELERRFGETAAGEAVASSFVDEIETLARRVLAAIPETEKLALARQRPRIVVATTDVHFYGKRLLTLVLTRLGLDVIDGGVSVDADVLAERAAAASAEAVAVSTYNGVALSFAQKLMGELSRRKIAPRVFIGGRLNEIMADAGSSLPVDVGAEIRQSGALPCRTVEELVAALVARTTEEEEGR
ncbi:hypothetical protein GCM10011390_26100 [Aureimonas endophytica]|uniref:B12-binding domain-containing protein n=1 Tax=Aureimonas endophytica TaxID=2027858 RepID=A0A916ZPL0_9HYPH|nr:cobalamin-dependent protein [Aureimonas endophytica]GGE05848.1 hypothetical protein GCM10011390_26100 [Aureimonas endophytica]